MIRFSLEDIEFNKKSIVTVGTFDGLHVAHKKILETLSEKARSIGSRSVLITFKPHPQEVLGKRKIEMLMTEEERVRMISNAGIDEICLLKFDRDFSLVTAEDFLVRLLYEKVGLHELVLGFNHRFGHAAQGTVEFARKVGERTGFNVDYVDAVLVDGKTVSSSNIRRLLKEGDIETANRMLGRSYSLEGSVIRGDGRGRMLGYPTANLKLIDDRLLVPRFGVYVVEVNLEGDRLAGLASIGVRPTFEDGGKVIVEVWISDFDKDIYGKRIGVSFIHRLRDELKFDSADHLVAQMDQDKKMLNEFLLKTFNKQR
ncbi:MAG: bifunctional riboflavin kinase/FAD synthetase [Bacteroidetes bacterium]|nr:bifunctional riboflavin kinase/FAD synthetase [Bacteroidota bacterium]